MWRWIVWGLSLALLCTAGCQCKSPGECSADADCATGSRCADSRCFAKGACEKDSHCLFGELCVGQKCKSNRCTKNQDCKAEQFCDLGSCIPRKGVGDVCAQANAPCMPGFTCIEVAQDKQSYCFQDCTKDAKLCKDPRPSCVAFAVTPKGATLSVCLKLAKRDESCSFSTQAQSICSPGQQPPLYCEKQLGGKCANGEVRSGPRELCNFPHTDDDPLQLCDEQAGLVCNPTRGWCERSKRTANEGEACDLTGAILGETVTCGRIMRCIAFTFDKRIQRCAHPCTPGAKDACSQALGSQCTALFKNGRGLCMRPCKSDGDCKNPGDTCQRQTDGPAFCLPGVPSGPVAAGGLCNDTGDDTRCQKGLFCLAVAGTPAGFCSAQCNDDADCPKMKDNDGKELDSTCTVTHPETQSKACIVPCDAKNKAAAKCPSSLSCLPFSGGLCMAP